MEERMTSWNVGVHELPPKRVGLVVGRGPVIIARAEIARRPRLVVLFAAS
jgi:hypothetical protein